MSLLLSDLDLAILKFLGTNPQTKNDLQYGTVIGLLQEILKNLNPTAVTIPPEKINTYSFMVVKVGAATVQLSSGQLLCRLAILQNTNTSSTLPTTPITISDAKNKIAAGTLNPPTTAKQAGGSWPISAPAPGEFIDLSQIFLTGSDAGDQVSVGYV